MKCGKCGGESRVIDTRAGNRRRRECETCRYRWTTRELSEQEVAQLARKAAKLDELAAMAAAAAA